MANEKIVAGLDARSGKNSLARLAGAPRNVTEITEVSERIDRNSKRLAEFSNIGEGIDAYEAERKAYWREAGRRVLDGGQVLETMTAENQRRMVADDVAAERDRILADTETQREKLDRQIREDRHKLEAIADLYADPVAILKTGTLGSERRAAYSRDLEHSGPAEIEAVFRRAVVAGDRDMAAAAMGRMDAMPRDARDAVRVSRGEVANAVVGGEHRKAQIAILGSQVASERALIAHDRAQGRDVPSARRMAVGAMAKRLEGLAGSADTN